MSIASLLQSTRDILIHLGKRMSSLKTHSRYLLGREESRRESASASVEKGSSQLNMHKAYMGLFRGRVFLGRRFMGWELVGFQSLCLNKLRVGWISCSWIGWFYAQVVKARVCFIGCGFRDKVCFFHLALLKIMALVSGPQCIFHWLWNQGQSVFH